MGGEEGLYYAGDGVPGPDDLGLAWDAAERYAVTLLREALPEAQAAPVPAGELAAEAARFRSAARKWPYRQLARAAWGQRPRKRSPADDTDLWLDAAGAIATMRRHIGAGSPLLEPVTLLRPATGSALSPAWSGPASIPSPRPGISSGMPGNARRPSVRRNSVMKPWPTIRSLVAWLTTSHCAAGSRQRCCAGRRSGPSVSSGG